MPGECLHSFIYRTHLLHGIGELSNILSSNGSLRSYPRILKGTYQYFESLNENEVFNYFHDVKLMRYHANVFEKHFKYREVMLYFFRARARHLMRRNYSHLKYCMECIRERLHSNGFVYFSKHWVNNTYCDKHQVGYSFTLSKSRNEGKTVLQCLFKGEHPNKYSQFDWKYNSTTSKFDTSIISTPMAPCLEAKFKEFIVTKRFDFPESLSRSLVYSVTSKHINDSFFLKNYVAYKVLKLLAENKIKLFTDFVLNEVKTISVGIGVIHQQSVLKPMNKHVDSQCNNCTYVECYIHPDLMRVRRKSEEVIIKKVLCES